MTGTFPDELPFQRTQVGFVDSWDDAQEAMRWLGQTRDVLAIDTETSGFDPYAANARIRLFQIGDVNTGWTIDAQKWPGLCQHVLNEYQGQIAFHNIDFDSRWIQVHWPTVKFPWSKCHDTMLYSRIADNEASAALKELGRKHYGNAAVAGQQALDQGMTTNKWTWDTVPLDFPPYSQYAALDTVLTARMWRKFHNVHSGEFKRVAQLEMETRRICTTMSLRGMKIDVDYCTNKSEELDDYVETLISHCTSEYGINIGSTVQLGKWFLDNGAELTEFTATGVPKMNEHVLTGLAVKYPLAQHALDARKATKINGTYLKNFIRYGENDGSIVHPQINTMAARTGRMSVQDPALQTLPRDDKAVRPSIIPHDGEVLLSSDLDQVEFRYISALSEDPGLIARFQQADSVGPDVFTQIGRDVFEDPTMVKSDKRRAVIKTMIYARLYGAGLEKQAMSAGIPYTRMKEISDAFDASYPELNRYQKTTGARLETMARSGERPYVTTFTGRRLYVAPDRTYAGINYLVQGSCAEIMKYNLIDLDMAGLGDAMLVPVHDEIILSVSPGEVDEAKQIIKECMTTSDFAIPLPADCSEPMERWVKS